MLNGFERQTEQLSDYERYELLPIMVKCLERKKGKEKAVKNATMCSRLEERGYKVGEARIRKIINYIRVKNLVPCLMATSEGYYVSDSETEIRDYISSLKGREEAIRTVRRALEEQLEQLLKGNV